jgi:hypothetical protein
MEGEVWQEPFCYRQRDQAAKSVSNGRRGTYHVSPNKPLERPGMNAVRPAERAGAPGNGPFAGKLTDIAMLLVTRGRERTAKEYQALLADAGFTVTRIVPTRSPASVIEAIPA